MLPTCNEKYLTWFENKHLSSSLDFCIVMKRGQHVQKTCSLWVFLTIINSLVETRTILAQKLSAWRIICTWQILESNIHLCQRSFERQISPATSNYNRKILISDITDLKVSYTKALQRNIALIVLGAVHKLYRLKIGDFWPPPPSLSRLFTKQNRKFLTLLPETT